MAKILPTGAGPAVELDGGQLIYLSGSKLFARVRPTPLDPAAAAQLRLRNSLATGARTFAYTLTPAQRTPWTDNSRYAAAGNLELIATGIATNQANQTPPTTRTNDATPAPPTFVNVGYIQPVFDLVVALTPTGPSAGRKFSYYATAPATTGRNASRTHERLIFETTASPSTISLTTAYLTTFGGLAPAGEPLTLRVVQTNPAIPTFTNALLCTQSVTNTLTNARAVLRENPVPRSGSRSVDLFAALQGVALGAPINLAVEAGAWSWTSPATIFNQVTATGTLADVLGRRRRASIRFTFSHPSGPQISILLAPDVGQ